MLGDVVAICNAAPFRFILGYFFLQNIQSEKTDMEKNHEGICGQLKDDIKKLEETTADLEKVRIEDRATVDQGLSRYLEGCRLLSSTSERKAFATLVQ